VSIGAVLATLIWFSLSTHESAAQWNEKWLAIGQYAHVYNEAIGKVQSNHGAQWPSIMGSHHHLSNHLWILVPGFTDPEGRTWDVKAVHSGPRVDGRGEVFPQEFRMISRFDQPVVTVDGLPTFQHVAVVDEIDPAMNADRMIHIVMNTLVGITVDLEVRAFSNEYQDDYHIYDFTFTNTGNTDDDDEIELPDQILEDVFFTQQIRWGNGLSSQAISGGSSYGRDFMEDQVGDGMEDYDTDLRAQFAWYGNEPSHTDFDPIGAPAIRRGRVDADTVGRLTGDEFMGRAYIHADRSTTDKSDDPLQPSAMKWITADNFLSSGQDTQNEQLNRMEYDFFVEGHTYPHHADVVEPHGDFAHPTGTPRLDALGGNNNLVGWGPYTLGPGESINIVMVEGIAGLEQEKATSAIGRAFKTMLANGNQYGDIEYDADGDGAIESDEVMDKNEWVMTSRDSLFKMFEKARDIYRSDYAAPKPPMPPSAFHVISGVDEIRLTWETFADANPQGFEIYRTQDHYRGRIQNDLEYDLIHVAGANEREFQDEDVTRGIGYYYYMKAIGATNQDDTGQTPTGVPLKSNRYFTQTYDPAQLKRGPGDNISASRIVPNPYNLASDREIRWPDQQDKIGFMNIPANCTIRIYTEIGTLIKTIEHTDGSGDEYWNMTTSSNQLVVSGVYIAHILDNDTGETISKPFVIIR
jgi:hypothetical protein